jgi:hypothetical protein
MQSVEEHQEISKEKTVVKPVKGRKRRHRGSTEERKGVIPFGYSRRIALGREQCGVFTPCKNCKIETRSRDYAIVDEAVFSPCRAEQNRIEPSRTEPNRTEPNRTEPCRAVNESLIVSHRLASLLPGNSYKHLDNATIKSVLPHVRSKIL